MPRFALLLALVLTGCGGPNFSSAETGEDGGLPVPTSSPVVEVPESSPPPRTPVRHEDAGKPPTPREDDAGGGFVDPPSQPEPDSGKPPISDPEPDAAAPAPNAELCREGTTRPGLIPTGGLDCGPVCGWTPETAPKGFSSMSRATCETTATCGDVETAVSSAVDWTVFLGSHDPACYRSIDGLSKNFTAGFAIGPGLCARFTASDSDRTFQQAPIHSFEFASCLIVTSGSVKVLSHKDAAPAWIRIETAPAEPGVPCPFHC